MVIQCDKLLMKYYMRESTFEQPESFQEKAEIIKEEWNQVIIEVLEKVYQSHNQELPQLASDKLIKQAPSLLEEATRENIEQGDNALMLLTAPTGVGKGTVGKGLEERGIKKLPRVNTRPIRPGEVDGKEYYFVSEEEFEKMKAEGQLFCATSTEEESKDANQNEQKETVKVARTQAGILKEKFGEMVSRGEKFYIDSGAGTVRRFKEEPEVQGINFKTVFLLPPSFDEMLNRVAGRRSDANDPMSDETLLDRFKIAVNHLRKSIDTVDGYVVNDVVERAVERLAKVLQK